MSKFSRRSFLAGVGAATATAACSPLIKPTSGAASTESKEKSDRRWASLIDITRCDGCPDRATPGCVSACRQANAHRFPEPDPAKLKDYWPQPFHEDWSTRRDVKDRLTPYNWTFVQEVTVDTDGGPVVVHMPRRCMHCDNPPCVKVCPFGVMKQTAEGPTYVDTPACMGGAKCRTVCPWDIPQRQAGVGLYTYLDPLPVGGGVMFKCDLCRETLADGGTPACATQCPRDAILIGDRKEIFAEAERRARRYGGNRWKEHLYGLEENGGTSTLYVSRVAVASIDAAIVAGADRRREQLASTDPEAAKRINPIRMHPVENMLDRHRGLIAGAVLAPLAGAAMAFAATVHRHQQPKLAASPEVEQSMTEEDDD